MLEERRRKNGGMPNRQELLFRLLCLLACSLQPLLSLSLSGRSEEQESSRSSSSLSEELEDRSTSCDPPRGSERERRHEEREGESKNNGQKKKLEGRTCSFFSPSSLPFALDRQPLSHRRSLSRMASAATAAAPPPPAAAPSRDASQGKERGRGKKTKRRGSWLEGDASIFSLARSFTSTSS